MDPRFQRHVDACNNAGLPGGRLKLRLAGEEAGWVDPALAGRLSAFLMAGCVSLPEAGLLPALARRLSDQGCFRHRGEAFDVRARPGGPVLTTIDRGALPAFGIMAEGVHLNGLVHRPDGPHLWVARRARDKALDPGKLDHLVAGGISAGMGPMDTLLKEAAEEAALPGSLARQAVAVGTVGYAMQRHEGLRRDLLHCYDLALPEDFVPRAADGEVESFELWPILRVFETVRDTNDFKFNVNLVLIELFGRLGMRGQA